jgi:exonuclease VII large subunit
MPVAKAAAKKTAAVRKPAPKTAKKVTFDDVWVGLDRLEKLHEKLREETAKSIEETRQAHRETEQAIKETQQAHRETERTLNRAIGGLSNTLGSLIEHIMTPDLPRKFKQFGFTFDRITTVKWANGEGNIYTEIDALLENGAQAMVVEVKTTLRRDDIDDHLERMERVRIYADDHGDKREFLGAMAGAITDKAIKEYALSKGFFVIEPSGEDVKITKPVSGIKIW